MGGTGLTIDTTDNQDLRQVLRSRTAHAHDTLDKTMSALDLADPSDYARFLQIQFRARRPIEAWCDEHCPTDLLPPAQTPAIARDLRALGRSLPEIDGGFVPPSDADPLGVAWALGGSSLGNRAMLAGLRRRDDEDRPVHFLADRAMTEFWRGLLPHLQRAPSARQAQAATAAAEAVFARFQRVADAMLVQEAA